MIFARNGLKVAAGDYTPAATFQGFNEESPILKLTVRVKDNDVILQATEQIPPAFGNPEVTEMLLERGAQHSRIPVTAWTAFRFRAPNGDATINLVAYS